MRYDWNWRRSLLESDLPSTTKHVLLTLSMHASDAGESMFPSASTLARQTSLTERAVRSHLKKGRDLGWISVEQRTGKGGRQTSNEYVLTFPGGVNDVQGEGEREGEGGGEPRSYPTTLNGSLKNGSSNGELFGTTGPQTNGKPSRPDPDDDWKTDEGFLELRALAQRRIRSIPDSHKKYRKALKTYSHADLMRARQAHVIEAGEDKFVKFLDPWLGKQMYIADLEVADSILGRDEDRRIEGSAARWY